MAAPKRIFKKFTFHNKELGELVELAETNKFVMEHLNSRAKRKFKRSSGRDIKQVRLLNKLKKAVRNAPIDEETGNRLKPATVRTHMRSTVIIPTMVGSVCGVYNGKGFVTVEVKPEMIGHYLGEFSITYHPVKHGRPGIGATHSSRFIPLK
jgi:small subunit ribosomal protein S15e